MAMKLKVTPEALKEFAGQMTQEIETVKNCFKSIDTEITGTQKYWKGEASDEHIKRYKEIKPDADKVVSKLTEAPKNLLEIAGIYVESEDANSQLAMTLPIDIFE